MIVLYADLYKGWKHLITKEISAVLLWMDFNVFVKKENKAKCFSCLGVFVWFHSVLFLWSQIIRKALEQPWVCPGDTPLKNKDKEEEGDSFSSLVSFKIKAEMFWKHDNISARMPSPRRPAPQRWAPHHALWKHRYKSAAVRRTLPNTSVEVDIWLYLQPVNNKAFIASAVDVM